MQVRELLLAMVIAADTQLMHKEDADREFARLLILCQRFCCFFSGCYSADPLDVLQDVRTACTAKLRALRSEKSEQNVDLKL